MGLQHTNLKQLCWKCKHSCDVDECIWVKTLKKRYSGTLLDDDGYIISCPKFERDNLLYDDKDRAEFLGITLSKYRSIKSYIKNNDIKMTVSEYLEFRKQLKDERESIICNDKTYYRRLYNARCYIKKLGLTITPEEYLEMRKKEKELRTGSNYNRNYQKNRYKQKVLSSFCDK